MMFAKVKTQLRKLDKRSVEETWRALGKLLDLVTPNECGNYIRHVGYDTF